MCSRMFLCVYDRERSGCPRPSVASIILAYWDQQITFLPYAPLACSHASQLVWHVTRGVMSPRARAKAVIYANAPTSTLSPAALASLLCSEWREATTAATASFWWAST